MLILTDQLFETTDTSHAEASATQAQSTSFIFVYSLSVSMPPSSTGLIAQITVLRDVFVRIENSLCFHLGGASILWRRRIGQAFVIFCGAVTDGLVRRVLPLNHLDPELLNVFLAAKVNPNVNTRSTQTLRQFPQSVVSELRTYIFMKECFPERLQSFSQWKHGCVFLSRALTSTPRESYRVISKTECT